MRLGNPQYSTKCGLMPAVRRVDGGFLFIAFRLEAAAKSEAQSRRANAGLVAGATRKTFNAICGVKRRAKETGKKYVYINTYMCMHKTRRKRMHPHVIEDYDFYKLLCHKFCRYVTLIQIKKINSGRNWKMYFIKSTYTRAGVCVKN